MRGIQWLQGRINTVDDRTTIFLGVLAGAVVGGFAGYLFLTEDGRRLREELEPKVADLFAELGKARSVVADARNVIGDVRPFRR